MNKVTYILFLILVFSCGKKEKRHVPQLLKTLSITKGIENLQHEWRYKIARMEYEQMLSPTSHDSIYKTSIHCHYPDSQHVYMVCKPILNLKKVLHYAKTRQFQHFDEKPASVDCWESSKILQMFFSDSLYEWGFQSMDRYFVAGYKKTPQCDYLFYESAGPCVGFYHNCLSFHKNGNFIDNIQLTWDWGYDGHYQTSVLEKLNDTTYVQISQNGDDYTNPKKGKYWQYDITRTEVIFHANGKIDTQILSYDSIPKTAKKIGEPI